REIAVEDHVRRRAKPALDQVHEQEGEIIKNVARREERIELERIEQDRASLQHHDIAEVQVAVSAPDEPLSAALGEEWPHALEFLPARSAQLLDFIRREQTGCLTQLDVVL